MKLQKTIIFFFLLITSSTFSQEKFEKEYRIKQSDAPSIAQEIIEKWNFPKKVKWYAEESNDGKTFEAKTCYNSNRCSIEFSEKGNLIDAEITIKFSKLPSELKGIIKKSLSKRYQKFRIKKIQVQYSGDENSVYKEIFQLNKMHRINSKYEIILKGKKNSKMNNYEILMNSKGKIEKELFIKSLNSINLEF